MEYRRFLDLTDNEIKDVITDIFRPTKIGYIERNKEWNEIEVEITTEWEVDEGEDNFEITEPITLRYTSDWIECNFSISHEDYIKWIKFLHSKGINPYYEKLKEEE